MNEVAQRGSIEDRIAERTDLTLAGSTQVSTSVGGLAFKDMAQVMEFSKLMAVSQQAVPKHLRGQPGACLAVSLQALNWRMDPFAVANKSYAVNDRIAYEAQLIHAVIEQRAPIKGRIKGKVSGEGNSRRWTLTAQPLDDDEPLVFEGVEFGKIKTKNSPLWQADPDQQLWYYTVRAMARRHFPDVIMGVYEKEELRAEMRDVTPQDEAPAPRRNLAQRLQAQEEPQQEVLPPSEVAQDGDNDSDVPMMDGEVMDLSAAFPGDPAWDEGVKAFKAGKHWTECPHDPVDDAGLHWLGGWMGAKEAGESVE